MAQCFLCDILYWAWGQGLAACVAAWGAMRAKKDCVPKTGHFLALYSKLHFALEEFFLVLGEWVGPPDHPPPHPWLSKTL